MDHGPDSHPYVGVVRPLALHCEFHQHGLYRWPFASLGSRMAQGSSGTGNEGEYNGGAKRAHLFLFDAVAQQGGSKICLGFVGQDNTRFCLRPANDQDPSTGTWFCGVQRHLIQFEPQDNTFYPRANEIIGFCSPSFPASLVPAQTLSEIKSER
jgi:hypothetical protein